MNDPNHVMIDWQEKHTISNANTTVANVNKFYAQKTFVTPTGGRARADQAVISQTEADKEANANKPAVTIMREISHHSAV